MKKLRKFIDQLMWRKLPDGRKTAGFGFYAVLILVPFLAIIVVRRSEEASNVLTGAGVEAPELATAIRQTAELEQAKAAPVLQSDRALTAVEEAAQSIEASTQEPTSRQAGSNPLDLAVVEATRDVEKERPRIDDKSTRLPGGGGSRGGVRPSAPRMGVGGQSGRSSGSGGAEMASISLDQLIKYPTPNERPASPKPADVAPSKWAEGRFLPRGHYIELYLLDTVRTDDTQPIITLAVARDVKFHGKVVIPFGTLLLATSSGNPDKGMRIALTPSSFQFPSGKELGVSAVIKGQDRAFGVPAYYMPPPMWTQMSAYVNDFLSGYLNLLYLRQQRLSGLKISSVEIGVSDPVFDSQSEALAVTSDVIKNFASTQMAELQARYAPHFVAPAGTAVQMQLLAPVSLDDQGVGVADLEAPPELPSSVMEAAVQGGAAAIDPALLAALQAANRTGTAR